MGKCDPDHHSPSPGFQPNLLIPSPSCQAERKLITDFEKFATLILEKTFSFVTSVSLKRLTFDTAPPGHNLFCLDSHKRQKKRMSSRGLCSGPCKCSENAWLLTVLIWRNLGVGGKKIKRAKQIYILINFKWNIKLSFQLIKLKILILKYLYNAHCTKFTGYLFLVGNLK